MTGLTARKWLKHAICLSLNEICHGEWLDGRRGWMEEVGWKRSNGSEVLNGSGWVDRGRQLRNRDRSISTLRPVVCKDFLFNSR